MVFGGLIGYRYCEKGVVCYCVCVIRFICKYIDIIIKGEREKERRKLGCM